ncbi:MAG TPA: type II toxin-antitoxin system RelE/ParE family toxin [Tepidisphaeraceae bacterium]|nr:type II toxin-antitoxin system RelE/ParE family toxin [Tepidisphaeraceae bacterium]
MCVSESPPLGRFRAGTYRAVYTVRFRHAIYVLHVFQKKSRSGIATAAEDIGRIRSRLKLAAQHHKETHE